MAIGPNRLKGSSTLYDVKSGPVRERVNLEQAENEKEEYITLKDYKRK